MITSEQSSDRSDCLARAQSDRRSGWISRRFARSTLIAALVGVAFLSPISGSVALAETSTDNAVSGAMVDWRQPWRARAGYPTATPLSSGATAAQSKGVVLIDTALPYDNVSGAGTGMVLTASGQVLTSDHVVEGASTIKVTVAETGKTYRATVVGSDQTADVALLQLQGASGLATIKIDNDKPFVGDKVTAVGNAGGTGTLAAAKGTILSLEEPSGAMVEDVVSGTAAAQAGLEAGDQITALGGHTVTSAEDVAALLTDHDPGDRIKIVWIDQTDSQHVATVTLGASPVA